MPRNSFGTAQTKTTYKNIHTRHSGLAGGFSRLCGFGWDRHQSTYQLSITLKAFWIVHKEGKRLTTASVGESFSEAPRPLGSGMSTCIVTYCSCILVETITCDWQLNVNITIEQAVFDRAFMVPSFSGHWLQFAGRKPKSDGVSRRCADGRRRKRIPERGLHSNLADRLGFCVHKESVRDVLDSHGLP